MSDNYHQAAQGGTGANHITLFHGDDIWYRDGNGNANGSAAKPDSESGPAAGTNNYYSQDYSGYSACANATQHCVAPVVNYLASLTPPLQPNCGALALLHPEQ
jgi:phospholipase C